MCYFFVIWGYEGDRISDPNSKKIAQFKQGLDRNANKKKKRKKMAVVEEGPRKTECRCTKEKHQ